MNRRVPQLYTIDATAELLAVSPDVVERLIHSGALSAVNVSAGTKRPRLRVRDEDLANFIASRSIGSVRDGAA